VEEKTATAEAEAARGTKFAKDEPKAAEETTEAAEETTEATAEDTAAADTAAEKKDDES
jgi:large subunit ribosomal protein L17